MTGSILPRSQKHKDSRAKTVCFDCKLHSTCKVNCMPGVGTRNSIMVVGSKVEQGDTAGKQPFKGVPGRKLDFILESAGLHRDAIFLTTAVKCDTPKNRKPSSKEITACRMHLLEEIRWVAPKVIVTMGTDALKQIFPGIEGSADDWRGFALPITNKKTGELVAYCVPTLSVTQAVANPTNDPIFIRDFKLAKQILKHKWHPPALDVEVETVTSIEQLRVVAEKLINADEFSFDLETEGFDFLTKRILCASFSIDGHKGYVIPVDKEFRVHGQDRSWQGMERDIVINELSKIFLSRAHKTAQNGKFDLKWLKAYGISVRNFDFDTMLAHHLVDSEKPHNLVFIAQWYDLIYEKYDARLEIEKKKVGNDYSKIDCDVLYHYAGIDAIVTQKLKPILKSELARTKTENVFNSISMKLNAVLAEMEYLGIKVNLEGMEEIIRQTNEGIERYTREICQILNTTEFKPNATKPLKEYFASKRVKLSKTTKTGAFSLDEEVLKNLVHDQRVGVLCEKILRLRELSKLKTTYLDGNGAVDSRTGDFKGMGNKLDANNYLHTNFNIHGTYTGRLSSNGPNLQNIPKAHGIRQLFIPDCVDDLFLDVDYKQLEVRIAAALSKDMILIQEIKDGVDLHSRNAATFLLNISEEEFLRVFEDESHPKHRIYKEKRRAAKAVTFGVLYGSTAQGVAAREKLPLQDCQDFIDKFFKKYHRLYEWIKSQWEKVLATHKVVSPTGRVVRFHDLEWANSRYCSEFDRSRRIEEVKRIAVNMPIQGYGSDIFQTKCIELAAFLRKNNLKSKFKLSIHDGFVINAKPDEWAILKIAVPRIMNIVLNKWTRYEVPLEIDYTFTRTWEGEKVAA